MNEYSWLIIPLLPFLILVAVFLLHRVPLIPFSIYIGLQFFFDSFPSVTHTPFIGPFSVMTLYSVYWFCFFMIYILMNRDLNPDGMWWLFISISIIIGVHFITAIASSHWAEFFDNNSKWIYLWAIAVWVKFSIKCHGIKPIMEVLHYCSLYPFLNLLFSLVTGDSVCSSAEVCRYVGSYLPQCHVSFIFFLSIPAGLYLLVTASEKRMKIIHASLIVFCHIGIFLSSYRTMWASLAFYWLLFLIPSFFKSDQKYKIYIACAVPILLIALGGWLGPKINNRITPLVVKLKEPIKHYRILSDGPKVISEPLPRHRPMVVRIHIWKVSLKSWFQAGMLEKLVGLGEGKINEITGQYLNLDTHARNTYISNLVETGILGFGAFILWIVMVTIKILPELKWLNWHVIVSLPVFFSVMISAVGTMSFRVPYGMICLATYLSMSLVRDSRGFIQNARFQASKTGTKTWGPGYTLNIRIPKKEE